jgi:hypothetical protein
MPDWLKFLGLIVLVLSLTWGGIVLIAALTPERPKGTPAEELRRDIFADNLGAVVSLAIFVTSIVLGLFMLLR